MAGCCVSLKALLRSVMSSSQRDKLLRCDEAALAEQMQEEEEEHENRGREHENRGRDVGHVVSQDNAFVRTENEHLIDVQARKVDKLPCSVEEFHQPNVLALGWNPTVKTLFCGTREDTVNNRSPVSPLTLLREHESTLLRRVCSFLSNEYAKHIRMTIPAGLVGRIHVRGQLVKYSQGRESRSYQVLPALPTTSARSQGFVSFATCGTVNFPEPAGRNVNMMPFIFGRKDSLPDELQCYHELIEQCPYSTQETGKVGYLTVHESYVETGNAQRREGLHIEAPATASLNRDDSQAAAAAFTPAAEHSWGIGIFFGPDYYEGGIYLASSVADTTQVWDALVDVNIPGITNQLGGCEYMRSMLGSGTKLRAGELVWMTDCTPHESLPLEQQPGYRQFFRVVTSRISHWYAAHSTPNPKVRVPDHIPVILQDKFHADDS